MPIITLPDGSQRSLPTPTDGAAVARSIGARLERDAVAVRIDGKLCDLTLPIERDARIEIVTRASAEGLEILRHDAAHVMAEAVKELYPETQVTIGPAIENGFYYDFARKEPFTPEDLERIERRMHEIVGRDETVVREVWERDAAVKFFLEQGERYKAQIIEAIPAGEPITLYRQGSFIDLCRGPHLPSTGRLGTGFKLMKLAGAYWRGDSRNEMLQRIYGTAWADAKELKAYLDRLEEAGLLERVRVIAAKQLVIELIRGIELRAVNRAQRVERIVQLALAPRDRLERVVGPAGVLAGIAHGRRVLGKLAHRVVPFLREQVMQPSAVRCAGLLDQA